MHNAWWKTSSLVPLPVIEEFDGFLKVLEPSLKAGEHCLVVLYHRGAAGATLDELELWARPEMRMNLKSTLRRLVDDKAYAHFDGVHYYVTRTGQLEVETRRLVG